MYDIVSNNNTLVGCALAKNEGHGFKKKKDIDYYHKIVIAFVKQYLIFN